MFTCTGVIGGKVACAESVTQQVGARPRNVQFKEVLHVLLWEESK